MKIYRYSSVLNRRVGGYSV